jgi:hypothetical protein
LLKVKKWITRMAIGFTVAKSSPCTVKVWSMFNMIYPKKISYPKYCELKCLNY